MSSPLFSLRYVLDESMIPPKVGFSTPRSLGPAVVRNRARRQLREIIRSAPPVHGLFLVSVRPGAIGQSSSVLAAQWSVFIDRVIVDRVIVDRVIVDRVKR